MLIASPVLTTGPTPSMRTELISSPTSLINKEKIKRVHFWSRYTLQSEYTVRRSEVSSSRLVTSGSLVLLHQFSEDDEAVGAVTAV